MLVDVRNDKIGDNKSALYSHTWTQLIQLMDNGYYYY